MVDTQELRPTDWGVWHQELQQLARTPGMTISRAINILEEGMGADHHRGFRGKINREAADAFKWPRLRNGLPIFRIGVVAGRHSAMLIDTKNQIIRTLVKDQITETTDAIVELGCGVARHLLSIRDAVEHRFPHIRYYGADLSDSALAASEILAGLEPDRPPVRFHKFNWLAPDFSFLEGSPRHVLFFSCHSIEQVKLIGDDLIPAMLAVAPEVTTVHEEPFGWQLANVNDPAEPIRIGSLVDQIAVSAILKQKEYNRNLAELVTSANRAGIVKLTMLEVDASGDGALLPASIAIWHKP